MNVTTYFFGLNQKNYFQLPADSSQRIFAEAAKLCKTREALIVHRDDSLIYYIYVRDTILNYWGLAVLLNDAGVSDLKKLVQMMRRIIPKANPVPQENGLSEKDLQTCEQSVHLLKDELAASPFLHPELPAPDLASAASTAEIELKTGTDVTPIEKRPWTVITLPASIPIASSTSRYAPIATPPPVPPVTPPFQPPVPKKKSKAWVVWLVIAILVTLGAAAFIFADLYSGDMERDDYTITVDSMPTEPAIEAAAYPVYDEPAATEMDSYPTDYYSPDDYYEAAEAVPDVDIDEPYPDSMSASDFMDQFE